MASYAPNSQVTIITTATTTDILAARGLSTTAASVKPRAITIRNIGAVSNTLTLIKVTAGSDPEITEFKLEGGGDWFNSSGKYFVGTGEKLTLTTSTTSAIHVDVNFSERTV